MILAVVAAVSVGVIGGLFFAFSTSVMPALRRLPPAQGMVAMQSINVSILNPIFLTTFLGSTVSCIAVALTAPFSDAGSPGLLMAGALVYLIGGFGVTAVVNVPMNRAIETVDPTVPDSSVAWARYLKRWTAANHVRAAASMGASALLTVGLLG
ncbi:DUF1772 domain-containing protein [Saxibacter everestensis]|uniref:DUF1772 domain-containing protein n=1 Tax=Saxibacter everestensis TaxID=2909229 RepID=A0ABY8QV25_9MICO|nr:DUF1772 domain-containing protein [Brevibacteriaceae bacterium ZFBP1038]